MYLACKYENGQQKYLIRESFYENDIITNRDLVELGDDPSVFIEYSGKNCYIAESISNQLQDCGLSADPFDLEELFFPFIDQYFRERVSPYIDRQKSRQWRTPDKTIRQQILEQSHIFDRRRLHFLRFGQINQVRLDRSVSLYRVLLGKSRDEIEQLCIAREGELSVREYYHYIFTIFDLQKFFHENFSRAIPEALDIEKVDVCFLKQVCKLDQDKSYWRGFKRDKKLPSYLVRYLSLYFDHNLPINNPWKEYVREFMNSHRTYSPPPGKKDMSLMRAKGVFGVSDTDYSDMTKKELTKLYRNKALELHPDKEGGDHDQFIELTNAYNELLRSL